MGDAVHARAQAALRSGRFAEAEHLLRQALTANAADDFALALAAELRVAQQRLDDALLLYAQAVMARTDALPYKERFTELARGIRAADWDPVPADALLACLQTPELDCSRLSGFWYSLVIREPGFRAACDLTGLANFDPANEIALAALRDPAHLHSPLLLEGLKRLIVYEPVFEQFLVRLRRLLLENHGAASIPLAAAIAHYAFHTDYIFEVSDAESARVGELRNRLSHSDLPAESGVAVFACYERLSRLPNATQIAARFAPSELIGDLVRLQIVEEFTFRRAADSIPALSAVRDEVSAAVRQQYEEFPYPRWDTVSPAKVLREWQALECTRDTEQILRGTRPRILVAGCGTGRETALLASIFSDASITAVDLSRVSLGYAQCRAQEYGLGNVSFYQADILELGSAGEQFDFVSATGVLHHLKDPAAGWEICTRLLRPGGLMRIGLYSAVGRKSVALAREAIRDGGYGADDPEMRRFRRDSPGLLSRPVLDELAQFTDYYQLSMYRDLLFHVQEHHFSLPEIGGLLVRFGLTFAGFYLASGELAKYSVEYPADRGRTELLNWDRFERRHPETFRNMYIFWCRKAA